MATANAGYPSYPDDNYLRQSRRQVTDNYQLGLVNNTWSGTKAQHGYEDSRSNLLKQYSRMREGLASPYAGRGLLNSGIWQNKLTQFQTDQTDAQKQLGQGYADQLGQLGSQREQLNSSYSGGIADINQTMADRQAAVAETLRRVRAGY